MTRARRATAREHRPHLVRRRTPGVQMNGGKRQVGRLETLRNPGRVGRHLRRRQVRTFGVDGQVRLGEVHLPDCVESLFQRELAETERRTRDIHGVAPRSRTRSVQFPQVPAPTPASAWYLPHTAFERSVRMRTGGNTNLTRRMQGKNRAWSWRWRRPISQDGCTEKIGHGHGHGQGHGEDPLPFPCCNERYGYRCFFPCPCPCPCPIFFPCPCPSPNSE